MDEEIVRHDPRRPRRPTAIRNMTLFPAVCGEKKAVTSS
jgi:hypothetical protein